MKTYVMTPSLELSRWDNCNAGSQNTVLWKNMDNYPKIIPVTLSYLEFCSETDNDYISVVTVTIAAVTVVGEEVMSEGDIGVEGPHLHTEEVDTQDHGQGHTHLVSTIDFYRFLCKSVLSSIHIR